MAGTRLNVNIRPKRDENGFTLPEVLVTILIMGIIAAIVIPSWFNLVESRKVDSATNQVAADLRLAHANATNRLAPAQFRFSSTGTGVACGGTTADYCLVQPTVGGPQSTPRNFEDNVVLNSPNLALVGGVSAIEFSASGSATAVGVLGGVGGISDDCPASYPAGTRKLQVTVDGRPAHCITFNEATSRIRID